MIPIEIFLKDLIQKAKELGLNEFDLNNAQELLKHYEYELSFDTLITQMFEYDLKINEETFALICKIGERLKLEENKFNFMKESVSFN